MQAQKKVIYVTPDGITVNIISEWRGITFVSADSSTGRLGVQNQAMRNGEYDSSCYDIFIMNYALKDV